MSELNRLVSAALRRGKRRALYARSLLFHPPLPSNPRGEVLIHLGCGNINSPEFINVDARGAPHVHYVRDVCDLRIFPNDHADLVYACHVLEHIEPTKTAGVLSEWNRIVKPGGVLRLSVPDFDKLLAIYLECDRDIDSIRTPLLGYRDGYNAHCMIFNRHSLERLLRDAGFILVREWDPGRTDHHDFEDWASKTIERQGHRFYVSLNLEGVKDSR